MTSKFTDGIADYLVRRRRRKVKGRAVVRERSLTPDAKMSSIITVATKVAALRISVDILPQQKTSVKPKQVKKKKKQNSAGLVDDGWGGRVEEGLAKLNGKLLQDNEGGKIVEQNIVKVRATKEHQVENDAILMNDVGHNKSEKEGYEEKHLHNVRKRTVVEDCLEKFKLQKRLHSGQVPDCYHEGHESRSLVTNVRGNGRGRIVCLDWQNERCTYGSTCKFLHGENAEENALRSEKSGLKGSPHIRGICFSWQNGRCRRGASCRFTHDSSKQKRGPKTCFSFKRGRCHRGDKCKFAHTSDKEEVCFDFKLGRCFRGELCRFSHDSLENAFVIRRGSRGVCFNWQMGICRRGLSCRFDHEEGSSQTNSFITVGAGSQLNRGDGFDEDYEFENDN